MTTKKEAAPAKVTASSLKPLNDTIEAPFGQARLSVFPHTKAKEPSGEIMLHDWFHDVKDGKHEQAVEYIRSLMADGREPEANRKKEGLEAVALSGWITSGGRKQAMQEGRLQHSGLLQIDIDEKDLCGALPDQARDTLANDPHIVCAFLSPRGNGVKAVMRIQCCTDAKQHKECFLAAESYMLGKYAWQIDKATKDPCRLCLVSYDPDAWWNGAAVPLDVERSKGGEEIENSSVISLPSTPSLLSTPSLHKPLKERIQAAGIARERLRDDRKLDKLYCRWVEQRYAAVQGKRNNHLIQRVTFLSRAVGKKRVIDLERAFYDCNQDVFTDPLEQHLHETQEHLKNTIARWWEAVPVNEQEAIHGLPICYIEAFRICRDLASTDTADSPRGEFFLADDDLSNRLGLPRGSHRKIFGGLESMGCLEMIQRGEKHTENKIGKATCYKWNWSLPEC